MVWVSGSAIQSASYDGEGGPATHLSPSLSLLLWNGATDVGFVSHCWSRRG